MQEKGKLCDEKKFLFICPNISGGDWSDPKVRFAEEMFHEHNFPKQSTDFNELSNYIESFATENLTIEAFDHLWELYEGQA